MLQHVSNQSCVAINVSAYLQDRRFTLAARQCHQIWLGQDHRDDDRLPSEFFKAQNQPDLFSERRAGIVVEDQISHDFCLSRSDELDDLFAKVFTLEQTQKCFGRGFKALGYRFTRLELASCYQHAQLL